MPDWTTSKAWTSFSVKSFFILWTLSCNMSFLRAIETKCKFVLLLFTFFMWMLFRSTFVAKPPLLLNLLLFFWYFPLLFFLLNYCNINALAHQMLPWPTFQASLLMSFLLFSCQYFLLFFLYFLLDSFLLLLFYPICFFNRVHQHVLWILNCFFQLG